MILAARVKAGWIEEEAPAPEPEEGDVEGEAEADSDESPAGEQAESGTAAS
jgi:hypothetical protein